MKKFFLTKCLCFSLLLLIVSIDTLRAFNGLVDLEIDLREVSFEDSDGADNNHTLISDDKGTTFENPHYTNPEVMPQDGNRFPTAYTKGTTPRVEMKFEVNVIILGVATPPTLWIKASGTENKNLKEKSFSLSNGSQTLTYDLEPTSEAFTDHIKFYGPGVGKFEFEWKYSIDGKKTWTTFHTSKHRIYLTEAMPIPSQGNRETLFYYACNKANGNDGADDTAVTHLIWGEFATRLMQRINHESGYLEGNVLKFTLKGGDILKSGEGICGNWTQFFRDVLAVHAYPSDYIDVDTTGGIVLPIVGLQNPVWWVVSEQAVVQGYVEPTEINWNRGQGGVHPYKDWRAHAIAKAHGEYYDASYGVGGTGVDTHQKYEARAVSGYKYMEKDDDEETGKEAWVPRPGGDIKRLKYSD